MPNVRGNDTSKYLYPYQYEKELVDRKSVIIDMSKEHLNSSLQIDQCDSSSFNQNYDRQHLSTSFQSKTSNKKSNRYSSIERYNRGISINAQKPLEMASNQTIRRDSITSPGNETKSKIELYLTEKEQRYAYNMKKTELDNNVTCTNLPQNSNYTSNNIFSAYNSCLGKPTAHVEPFVSELKLRSNQRSTVTYDDSVPVVMDCNDNFKETSSEINGIKQKINPNSILEVKASSIDEGPHLYNVSNSADISYVINDNKANMSKLKANYNTSGSIGTTGIGTLTEPTNITIKGRYVGKCHLKSGNHDTNSKDDYQTRLRIMPCNESEIDKNIHRVTPQEERNFVEIIQNVDTLNNGRSKSLSCNNLKLLNINNYDKMKRYLSLPDLTSAKITGISKLSIKRVYVKKLEDTNSSSGSTEEDVDITGESSSDGDEKSLRVDEINNTEASDSTNSHIEIVPLQGSVKHPEIIRASKKKIRKGKAKKSGKKCCFKQTTEIENVSNKSAHKKRRSDKKKAKLNGTVINRIRQQEDLNEQERGKRLAQELPGFNWLEEKIRNKEDISKSGINPQKDKHVPNSCMRKSLSVNLKEQLPIDLKTNHNTIPALISNIELTGLQQTSKLPQNSSLSSFRQPNFNAFKEEKSKMTLNTVSSSTPHNSEDVAKKTQEYAEAAADESKHEVENEPPSNVTSYQKRHIQTAVPPLIPTYKVTALPKQRKSSIELKSSRNQIQDNLIYESKDTCETTTCKPLINDNEVTLSSNTDEEKSPEAANLNEERRKPCVSHNNKLSILKEAFKSKLNGCSELKSFDGERLRCEESNIPTIRHSTPPETSQTGKTEEHSMVSRRNSKTEEVYINSPESQSDKGSPMPSDVGSSSLTNSLLEKILMHDGKSTINSPLVVATLLEELMKTRKEVEKLRKVQEQMLKGEKCYEVGTESESNKCSPAVVNLSSEEQTPPLTICEPEESNENRLQGILDAKNNKKRACTEQNYINKKQKVSPQPPDDTNTITIRYTLPQPPIECNSESVESRDPVKLRDMLGICNNDLDVLPVENRSLFHRHDLSFNTRKLIPPPENPLLKYNQEKTMSKEEPYKNELMRLLDPSSKYQRPNLPELPNLIPSSNCSPSAFHKNIPFYSDKMPTNMVRYPYPPSNATHPTKQGSQTVESYSYHPRFFYENRSDGIIDREMNEAHSNNKVSLLKHTEKPYSTINSRHSPHREVIATRNDRFPNLNYPPQFNEKNTYETKIVKAKILAPPPQTFQPKILIPPENTPHYKEWHPAIHHGVSIVDTRSYQRITQPPIYVKPLMNSTVTSANHYKPGMNSKVTEGYLKSYSTNVGQCDPSATKQGREKSHSPSDIKSTRGPTCTNPFIPSPGMAHSSSNSYYSSQMRSMQPPIIPVNHSQFPQGMLPSRNPAAQKQVFYDQRPVIQPIQGQKAPASFPHRNYSPPPPRRDNQLPQRYILPRPQEMYENRPISIDDHDKKQPHPSNRLSPDITQSRIINNIPKSFQESLNSSPLRNCSPNASTDQTVKTLSKKCLICDRLAQFLCSGCKLAWYCSKECQREHWSEHSPTCNTKR